MIGTKKRFFTRIRRAGAKAYMALFALVGFAPMLWAQITPPSAPTVVTQTGNTPGNYTKCGGAATNATFTVNGVGGNEKIRVYAHPAPPSPSAGAVPANLGSSLTDMSSTYSAPTVTTAGPATVGYTLNARGGQYVAPPPPPYFSTLAARVNITNGTLSLSPASGNPPSNYASTNKVQWKWIGTPPQQEVGYLRFKVRFTGSGNGTFYVSLGNDNTDPNSINNVNVDQTGIVQDKDLAALAFQVNGSSVNVSYTNGGVPQSLNAFPNIFGAEYIVEMYGYKPGLSNRFLFSRGSNQYELQSGQWIMFMGPANGNVQQVIPPTQLYFSGTPGFNSVCFAATNGGTDPSAAPRMEISEVRFNYGLGSALGKVYNNMTQVSGVAYSGTGNTLTNNNIGQPLGFGPGTFAVSGITNALSPVDIYIASFNPMTGAESPRVLVKVTDNVAPTTPATPAPSIVGRCNGPGLVTFTVAHPGGTGNTVRLTSQANNPVIYKPFSPLPTPPQGSYSVSPATGGAGTVFTVTYNLTAPDLTVVLRSALVGNDNNATMFPGCISNGYPFINTPGNTNNIVVTSTPPNTPSAPIYSSTTFSRCGAGQITITPLTPTAINDVDGSGAASQSGEFIFGLYTTPTGGAPIATSGTSISTDGGNFSITDATITHNFTTPGTYYVGIGKPAFTTVAPFFYCEGPRTPILVNFVGNPPSLTGTVTNNGPFCLATFPSTSDPLILNGTFSGLTPTLVQVDDDMNFGSPENLYVPGAPILPGFPLSTSGSISISGSNYTVNVTGGLTLTNNAMNTVYLRAIAPGCTSNVVSSVFGYSNTAPAAPTVNQTVKPCGSGTAVFTASVSGLTQSSVRLYTVPSGGSPVGTVTPTQNANVHQVSYNLTNTTQLWFSTVIPGSGCESATRTPVTADVYSLPPLPTFSNVTRCGSGQATFTFTFTNPPFTPPIPAGSQIRLYTQASGGNAPLVIFPTTTTTTTFFVTTPHLTSTTTYYVEYAESHTTPPAVCASASPRPAIVATVLSSNLATPTVANITQCLTTPQTSATFTFTLTPGTPAATTYEFSTDANFSTPIALGTPTIQGSNLLLTVSTNSVPTLGGPVGSPKTYYFRGISAGGCTTNVAQATVTWHQTSANLPTITYSNVARCGAGSVTFTAGGNINSPFNAVRLFTVTTGGTAVASSIVSPYDITPPSINTTTSYYLEEYHTVTGCSSNRATAPMVATVIDAPPVPTFPPAVTFCGNNQAVTFTASLPNISGSYQLRLYNSQTATTPIVTTPPTLTFSVNQGQLTTTVTLNNLFNTTNYFAEVIRMGTSPTPNCTSSRVQLTVTRQDVNSIPAIPDLQVCETTAGGPTNFTIAFTANLGNQSQVRLFAQQNATNPIGESTANNTYSFPVTETFNITSPNVSTTVSYWIGVINLTNNCSTANADRREIKVIAYRRPTGSSFGTVTISPQSTLCGSGNVTILVADANSTNRTGARLYDAPIGGSKIAEATALTNGNFVLTTTQPITSSRIVYLAEYDKFSGCEQTTRTPVAINIGNTPSPPSVADVARCDEGTNNVTFTVTNVSPGAVIRLYTQPVFFSGETSLDQKSLPPYELTAPNVSITTTYYVASALIGTNFITGCESARKPVVATIKPRPAQPILLEQSQRCGIGNAEFRIDPSSVPAGSEVRLYTFSGTVPGANDPLGSPISSDGSAPYSVMSAAPIATNTQFHLAVFNPNTGCESPRFAAMAYVNPGPSLPLANDVTICGPGVGVFTVNLGTNPTTFGNVSLRLYDSPTANTPVATYPLTGGSIQITSPAVSTTTNYYIAVYDNNVYNVPNVGAGCESPRKMVTLNVVSRPVAQLVANVGRCGTGLVIFTPQIGAQQVTEVRLWSSSTSTALSDFVTASVAAPYALPVNLSNTGASTYYVEWVNNTANISCVSPTRTEVIATASDYPATPTVASTAITICGPGSVTIEANNSTPGATGVRLYTQPVGGVAVGEDIRQIPPYFVSTDVQSNTQLYIGSLNPVTGCESQVRQPVYVFVSSNTRPSAPVVTNLTGSLLCQGLGSNIIINAQMGAIAGQQMRIYTVEAGGTPAGAVNASPFQFSVNPSSNATYYLAAVNTITGCESDRTPVPIRVGNALNPPTVNNAAVTRCGAGSVTFTATLNNTSTGDVVKLYTQNTGGSSVAQFNAIPLQTGAEFIINTPVVATNTVYYASAFDSNTGCESTSRVALNITVNAVPETPVSQSVGRCSVGPVVFTATMGVPAGSEMRLYAQASGGSPIAVDSAAPFELSTGNLGNGTVPFFIASYDNGTGCESVRLQVNAVVSSGVSNPVGITSRQVGCGSGVVTFSANLGAPTASLISGNGLRLYATATGGTPIAQTTQAPYRLSTPNISNTTQYFIAAFESVSGCESARVPATATVVSGAPNTPQASATATCASGNVSVNINVTQGDVTGNEVRLYDSATGGTLIETTSTEPFVLATPQISQTTTYYVAVGSGSCESIRREVVVTVNQVPGTPVASNTQRCGSGAVTFNVLNVTPGARAVLYDAPVGGNVIDQDDTAPYTLRANINTTTNYWIAVETANCVSSRTQVTANVSDQPPVHSFVNNNIAVCSGSQGTFIANLNGFGNELRMYNAPTGGNIVAVASGITNNTTPFSLRTPALTASTQYYVAAYDASTGCETSRLPVSATVGSPATPQVSSANVTRCGFGTVQFTAFQGSPAGSEIRLYDSPTSMEPISVADMATGSNNAFVVTSTVLSRPQQVFYVASGAGSCESARVPVTAILLAGPSAPTASDVARCGSGVVVFTANMGAVPGTVIRLYDSNGNLVDSKNSFPYELTSSFITETSTFFVAVANSQCETSRVPVVARVGGNPSSPVPVANVLSLCGRGSVTFLVNMGSNPGTEIRLYAEATGGSPIAVDNSFPYELSTPMIMSTTNYFLASAIGSCESPRVQVTAVATQAPSAPSANNVTICGAGSGVITATMGSISGSEIRLYASEIGGMPIAVDNTLPYELTTPVVNNTTNFFVSSASGSCESIRVPVSVIVGSAIVPPTVNDVSICGAGTATFNVINNFGGGSEVRLYGSATGGSALAIDNEAPFSLTTPAITTNTEFWISSATSSCESQRVRVVANVLLGSTPSAPTATAVTRCGPGSVTIQASMGANPGQEMRLYTSQVGGFLVATASSAPYQLFVPQVNGSTTFFVAAGNGVCESARTPVNVTVTELAPLPSVNTVAVCQGTNSAASFTVTFGSPVPAGTFVELYTVPFGGTAVATSASAPYVLQTPPVAFTSTFYVEAKTGSNCEAVRVPAVVVVAGTPLAPSVAPVSACGVSAVTLTATVPSAVPGTEVRVYASATGGVPVAIDNVAPYEITVPVSGSTTFFVSSAVAGGNCESTRRAVVVNVSAPISVTASASAVSCTDLARVTANATGTGPFEYRLVDAALGQGGIAQPSGIFTQVSEGRYFVEVINLAGCVARTDEFEVRATAGPLGVTASSITQSTAIINWNAMNPSEIVGYEVRYRVAGSTGNFEQLINITGNITNTTLTGLQSGTNYEVQVRGICGTGRRTDWASATFSTTGNVGEGICATPTNIRVSAIDTRNALITWTPNTAGAVCYIVTYGPAGTSPSTWPQFLISHPGSSLTATNLEAGVQYEVRIRTNCTTCSFRGGVITQASAPVFFNTSGRRLEASEAASLDLKVYPNPTSGRFTVNFNAVEAGDVGIEVVDITGRVVFNNSFEATAGSNEIPVDLSGNTSGIYLVKFRQGSVTATAKITLN
jgi:hypothetical protein